MHVEESLTLFKTLKPHTVQRVPLEGRGDIEPSALVGVEATLEATLVSSPLAEMPFFIQEGRPRTGVLAGRATKALPVILVLVESTDPVQRTALGDDTTVEN